MGRVLLTWLCVATGCVGAAGADPLADGRSVGVLSFDASGRTPPVALDDLEGEAWALWAQAAPDTCFAIEAVGSAARGASLDLVDGPVRYQRLRCSTGTPLREPLANALSLSLLSRARVPPTGRLRLRFVVTEHSALRAAPEGPRALLEALSAELAGAGLTPELVEVVDVTGAPVTSRFSDLETEALDELLDLAPPRPPATVDVVFAGCLRRVDVTGVGSAVLGFTGRVGGGGGGSADAIFMPGVRCGSTTPTSVDPERVAHVLAHELGHYLGLAHTEGGSDIMHSNPELAGATGFTESQGHRMRRHPFVQAEVER